jgi:hypothetical protein
MASDGDMLDEEAVEEGVDRRRWETDTARISVSKTSGSVIILRRGKFLGEVLKRIWPPTYIPPTGPLIQVKF